MPAKKKRKPIINKKTQNEFKVEGRKVVSKIKQLIKEGNVRSITVKDKKGKTIMSFPVTAGVLGAVIVPPLAVLGVLAAFITECTITVKRGK